MKRPAGRGGARKIRTAANNGCSFNAPPLKAQALAIPESEAEALAWGYGLPPADHLTACCTIWWRLRRLGVPLPVERRVILIGGGHG